MTTDSLRAAAQRLLDARDAMLAGPTNTHAWLAVQAAAEALRAALAVPQEEENPLLPLHGCWCLQCEEARKRSVPPESAGEPRKPSDAAIERAFKRLKGMQTACSTLQDVAKIVQAAYAEDFGSSPQPGAGEGEK